MCGYNKSIITGAGVPPPTVSGPFLVSGGARLAFSGRRGRLWGTFFAAKGMGVPPGAPHRGDVGVVLAFRLQNISRDKGASVKGTPVLRWPALALLRSLLRRPASGPSFCL
jgi:hypothetical protein